MPRRDVARVVTSFYEDRSLARRDRLRDDDGLREAEPGPVDAEEHRVSVG